LVVRVGGGVVGGGVGPCDSVPTSHALKYRTTQVLRRFSLTLVIRFRRRQSLDDTISERVATRQITAHLTAVADVGKYWRLGVSAFTHYFA